MTRLIVDENVHKKLLALTHPVELCDSEGRVIARVTPVLDPALYEGLECPVSREELDRRKKNMDNPNNRTLGELLNDVIKGPSDCSPTTPATHPPASAPRASQGAEP